MYHKKAWGRMANRPRYRLAFPLNNKNTWSYTLSLPTMCLTCCKVLCTKVSLILSWLIVNLRGRTRGKMPWLVCKLPILQSHSHYNTSLYKGIQSYESHHVHKDTSKINSSGFISKNLSQRSDPVRRGPKPRFLRMAGRNLTDFFLFLLLLIRN